MAAARAAFLAARKKKAEGDEEGEEASAYRFMVPLKNNVAFDGHGLRFRVEGVTLEGGIETSRIVWEGTTTLTADELLNDAGRSRFSRCAWRSAKARACSG